jgi:hypothetical protein
MARALLLLPALAWGRVKQGLGAVTSLAALGGAMGLGADGAAVDAPTQQAAASTTSTSVRTTTTEDEHKRRASVLILVL